jgi:hypothetical protein
LPPRTWLFVPLWGMVTWFVYAARGGSARNMGCWWSVCLGVMGSGP